MQDNVKFSATLAIDEAVRSRRQAGEEVLHLGFGEAGLPVLPELVDVLATSGERNSYGPVVGSFEARAAAAGWFTRRGVATQPDQIVLAPGSKPLLFGLLAAIEGDVVLPRPAWVSYAAQAALLKRQVVWVPVPKESGGLPDPGLLEEALQLAKASGARPAVMVLTVPDNPTGTVALPEHLEAVCAIAERHGLWVICDQIYAELCHYGTAPSAVTYLPERTVITSGLSKSLALGGWRIGYMRTPDGDWGRRLRQDLTAVASEVWSCLAAPMQAVATYVLGDPSLITDHINNSRRLHARVASAVHAELVRAGCRCRAPEAGFYLYPDFGPVGPALRARGITTSNELATELLERHGVAVLTGTAFGDPAPLLIARVATSLLYGSTAEERWAALKADDPSDLPWVAHALAKLRRELRALTEVRD